MSLKSPSERTYYLRRALAAAASLSEALQLQLAQETWEPARISLKFSLYEAMRLGADIAQVRDDIETHERGEVPEIRIV